MGVVVVVVVVVDLLNNKLEFQKDINSYDSDWPKGHQY